MSNPFFYLVTQHDFTRTDAENEHEDHTHEAGTFEEARSLAAALIPRNGYVKIAEYPADYNGGDIKLWFCASGDDCDAADPEIPHDIED